jgi:hypothetical protein
MKRKLGHTEKKVKDAWTTGYSKKMATYNPKRKITAETNLLMF